MSTFRRRNSLDSKVFGERWHGNGICFGMDGGPRSPTLGGVDRGFILSDHADWDGLLNIVRNSNAKRVGVTHGSTEAFLDISESLKDSKALSSATNEPPATETTDEALCPARFGIGTNGGTSRKVNALSSYFQEVDAHDGAWAVRLLTGQRPKNSGPVKIFASWCTNTLVYRTG